MNLQSARVVQCLANVLRGAQLKLFMFTAFTEPEEAVMCPIEPSGGKLTDCNNTISLFKYK